MLSYLYLCAVQNIAVCLENYERKDINLSLYFYMKDLIISILAVLILAGCISAPDKAGTPLGDSWKSFYSTYDVEKLDKPTKAAYVPSETLQMYPSPSVEESKRYDSFKYWEHMLYEHRYSGIFLF